MSVFEIQLYSYTYIPIGNSKNVQVFYYYYSPRESYRDSMTAIIVLFYY